MRIRGSLLVVACSGWGVSWLVGFGDAASSAFLKFTRPRATSTRMGSNGFLGGGRTLAGNISTLC